MNLNDKIKYKLFNEETEKIIYEKYLQKISSVKDLSKEYGCGIKAIYNVLKRNNILIRARSESNKLLNKKQELEYQKHHFDIDLTKIYQLRSNDRVLYCVSGTQFYFLFNKFYEYSNLKRYKKLSIIEIDGENERILIEWKDDSESM